MNLFYRDRHQEVREENICLRISGLLCVYVPFSHLLRSVQVFVAGQVRGVPLLRRAMLLSRKGTPSSLVSCIRKKDLSLASAVSQGTLQSHVTGTPCLVLREYMHFSAWLQTGLLAVFTGEWLGFMYLFLSSY